MLCNILPCKCVPGGDTASPACLQRPRPPLIPRGQPWPLSTMAAFSVHRCLHKAFIALLTHRDKALLPVMSDLFFFYFFLDSCRLPPTHDHPVFS